MKRMRKGTKSCLACRRRKIKCIFPTSTATVCDGCSQRSLQCVPQGIVDGDELDDTKDDDSPASTRLRHPESERTRRLEALISELEHVLEVGDDRNTINFIKAAIDDLPPPASEHMSLPSHPLTRASSSASPAASEQAMESGTAPLMRLLENPVLGRTETLGTGYGTAENSTKSPSAVSVSIVDPQKHRDALRDLLAYLPSETETDRIFQYQSSWWLLWRDTLGLVWGGKEAHSLKEFAAQALRDRSPCIVGLLLICFAISTNNPRRFLPPVERWILNDDEWAATEHGVSCLLASGICYLNFMQPRRAWVITRRAISLLQLNGIHHSHRKSERQDNLFWQVFHSDRWISMTVGMPYSMPDQFCDLTIASVTDLGPSLWLYRQLSVLSGRVIDSLQGMKKSHMDAALEIDENLDIIRSQLPKNYLDLTVVGKILDKPERHTRLYRVIHWHLLRAYVYLPILLGSKSDDRFEVGRKTAIEDSRTIVQAYLMCFDSDHDLVSNGSVLNFNAFIASIVVLLKLMGYGPDDSNARRGSVIEAEDQEDWKMIYRTIDVLKKVETGMAGALCLQCRNALESLVRSARTVDTGDSASHSAAKLVVLPYFGTITISRPSQRFKGRKDALEHASTQPSAAHQTSITGAERVKEGQNDNPWSHPSTSFPSTSQAATETQFFYQNPYVPNINDPPMDISIAYHGPYMPGNSLPFQAPFQTNQTHPLFNSPPTWTTHANQPLKQQNFQESSIPPLQDPQSSAFPHTSAQQYPHPPHFDHHSPLPMQPPMGSQASFADYSHGLFSSQQHFPQAGGVQGDGDQIWTQFPLESFNEEDWNWLNADLPPNMTF